MAGMELGQRRQRALETRDREGVKELDGIPANLPKFLVWPYNKLAYCSHKITTSRRISKHSGTTTSA